jgi:hypothetical protein
MNCRICNQPFKKGEKYKWNVGKVHLSCFSGAKRSEVLQGCPPSANCSAGAGADARNDSLIGSPVPREKAVFPALPSGMTREEVVEGLRELRDDAVRAEKAKDSSFVRWPDLDAILDYIEQHGFPAPENAPHCKGERALARNPS